MNLKLIKHKLRGSNFADRRDNQMYKPTKMKNYESLPKPPDEVFIYAPFYF